MKVALTIAFLVGMLLSAAPLTAGQHEEHLHPPAGKSSDYDPKTALKISQEAIGRVVADYQFTDSSGKRVAMHDFRGRPLVISMIYTSCHHICPMTTQHLKQVVKKARNVFGDDSFTVLSIGFDTLNDKPDAMRMFAAQQGVDMPGWYFLSADEQTIKQLAENLGFVFFPSAKGFDHLLQATVVDGDGKIYRQVYGMKFDTPKLIEPLKELVYGKPQQNSSLLTHFGNRIRLFCTVYDPASDTYRLDYSIFIGMIIGLISMGIVGYFLVREWKHSRS